MTKTQKSLIAASAVLLTTGFGLELAHAITISSNQSGNLPKSIVVNISTNYIPPFPGMTSPGYIYCGQSQGFGICQANNFAMAVGKSKNKAIVKLDSHAGLNTKAPIFTFASTQSNGRQKPILSNPLSSVTLDFLRQYAKTGATSISYDCQIRSDTGTFICHRKL